MPLNYLLEIHKQDILNILKHPEVNKHFSVNICFLELFDVYPHLGNQILNNPEETLSKWDSAVLSAQEKLLETFKTASIKPNVHCRIYGLPVCPELHRSIFPGNEDANVFLQVTGSVVRITAPKLLEYKRQYICTKCKQPVLVKAEYDKSNAIIAPKSCSNPNGCPGKTLVALDGINSEFCKDYQEIKIQEQVSKLSLGVIPNTMWVTLEDDLVDVCKPGDIVKISGTVKRRWSPLSLGKKMDIEIVLKANHVQIVNVSGSISLITPEFKNMFRDYWSKYKRDPLIGRDLILRSFCPQIFGLYLVKLALAIILSGGTQWEENDTGVRVRSESHILLVGDPGTGKSELLRFASKVTPRSVLTTGIGSTAAGLTATAVMENGEWQLEGGALVMSDGGICCIDEFNSMKENDRISILEAMEQQSISIAKAGIVCKLNTRCSVLAACNPKGNLDPLQPLCLNVGLGSPLLSRFDLILLLRDIVHQDWDDSVADYILKSKQTFSQLTETQKWNVDTLQAYFATVKKINPILTEEIQDILSKYYQLQRQMTQRNKSRTTVRLLDSLVRLSKGHARLMMHSEIEVIDAIYAIVLVDCAMEFDSRLLNIELSSQSIFPESPMLDYKNITEVVLNRLDLGHIYDKELSSYDFSTIVQSRFFSDKSGNNEEILNTSEEKKEESIEDNNKSQLDLEESKESQKTINKHKLSNQNKTEEREEISELLKNIPSVNDELPDIDFNLECNFVCSTQKSISSPRNKGFEKISSQSCKRSFESEGIHEIGIEKKFKFLEKDLSEANTLNIEKEQIVNLNNSIQPLDTNTKIKKFNLKEKYGFVWKGNKSSEIVKPTKTIFESDKDLNDSHFDI